MPYTIRKIRNQNKYKVLNTETKEIHAKGTTKENAEKQVRLLKQIESKNKKK
jgi:hypothetical protein